MSHNKTWHLLQKGEDKLIECCDPSCRDSQILGEDYCKQAILLKSDMESESAGLFAAFWPFPWEIWLLIFSLVAIVAVLFFMRSSLSKENTSGSSREAKTKKTR